MSLSILNSDLILVDCTLYNYIRDKWQMSQHLPRIAVVESNTGVLISSHRLPVDPEHASLD